MPVDRSATTQSAYAVDDRKCFDRPVCTEVVVNRNLDIITPILAEGIS